VYAEVTALLNLAWLRIVADDPSGARDEAQRALRRWSRIGFYVQHLYALRIETYCDLYQDDRERPSARA